MLKFLRLSLGLILTSLSLALAFLTPVNAQTVQSYNAATAMQPGVIVQLMPNSSNTVELLTQTNASKMFGVIINPNDSTVTLSAPNSKQVFVATTGTFSVLVSSQNGPIKTGDYIAISSLDGIGMKASSDDTTVLGKATNSFSGNGDSLGTTRLKDSAGSTTVHLGRVSVNLGVARNPLIKPVHNNLPSFLQSAGQSITNKPVSTARAYIGLLVLVISAIIAGSLLYAGVRSSIISIGRNPLSKKSIVRGLVQVTVTSLIVFVVGLFAVYLILRF